MHMYIYIYICTYICILNMNIESYIVIIEYYYSRIIIFNNDEGEGRRAQTGLH